MVGRSARPVVGTAGSRARWVPFGTCCLPGPAANLSTGRRDLPQPLVEGALDGARDVRDLPSADGLDGDVLWQLRTAGVARVPAMRRAHQHPGDLVRHRRGGRGRPPGGGGSLFVIVAQTFGGGASLAPATAAAQASPPLSRSAEPEITPPSSGIPTPAPSAEPTPTPSAAVIGATGRAPNPGRPSIPGPSTSRPGPCFRLRTPPCRASP